MSSRQKIRVAVVQFDSKIGKAQDNISRATEICNELAPRSVDLVCLPEMIFSGYVFPDSVAISPFLEEPQQGPTSIFVSELAKRLQCYVMAGYPERLKPEEHHTILKDGKEINQVGANSAVICDPEGNFIGNYRKTNLFMTDMTWAKPGTGFMTLHLPAPLNTVSLGICMDLNCQPPSEWGLETGPYEIADHCIDNQSNVLILLNAWLDSKEQEESDEDWRVLNYWAARLRPLWVTEQSAESDPAQPAKDHNTIVVVCNRCGEENDTLFAGSSAVYSMGGSSGRPRLLDCVGRKFEGVAVWTV